MKFKKNVRPNLKPKLSQIRFPFGQTRAKTKLTLIAFCPGL